MILGGWQARKIQLLLCIDVPCEKLWNTRMHKPKDVFSNFHLVFFVGPLLTYQSRLSLLFRRINMDERRTYRVFQMKLR